MRITVDIDESRIEDIAREAAESTISDKARYGSSLRHVIIEQVREQIMQFDVSAIVEKAVHEAVQKLPEMVSCELNRRVERLVKERMREHSKIVSLLEKKP